MVVVVFNQNVSHLRPVNADRFPERQLEMPVRLLISGSIVGDLNGIMWILLLKPSSEKDAFGNCF